MPTKNFTGPIDCLGAALPDEEYFVLLARDPAAPYLLAIWASLRVGNASAAVDNLRLMMGGGLLQHYQAHPDQAKSEEAIMVAQRMTDWRQANLGGPGEEPTWKKSLVRPKLMDFDLGDASPGDQELIEKRPWEKPEIRRFTAGQNGGDGTDD